LREFPKRRNDKFLDFGKLKILIGLELRNVFCCAGSELPRAAHLHCSAKNTPSATAGNQTAREKQVQETVTHLPALSCRSTLGPPAVEVPVR
jgi:hypothetical protein